MGVYDEDDTEKLVAATLAAAAVQARATVRGGAGGGSHVSRAVTYYWEILEELQKGPPAKE